MGMNFCALLRYRRTAAVLKAIATLENQRRPFSEEVQKCLGRYTPHWSHSCWIDLAPRGRLGRATHRQVKRPKHPNVHVALRTVDGFLFHFGQGVCYAESILRWCMFLQSPTFQSALLSACGAFADVVQATEAIITSDRHPAITAFFQGKNYSDCLRSAPPGQGEVEKLADLCRIVDHEGMMAGMLTPHGYWRFWPREVAGHDAAS